MNKREIFAVILEMVAEETEIAPGDILSCRKSREIVDARHLLIALLNDEGFYPSRIASMSGITVRAVLYAISNFPYRTAYEKTLRNSYEKLRKQIGSK